MSCLTSFLWKRELGQELKSWKLKSKTNDLAEDYGAQPVTNEPCELSGQCRATFLMDFSPDGKKIASTHGDHTVRITDIATGKCTHILRGHPRTPWCLAFHPSSNEILASGCLGGEVRIWDLHGRGSEVWQCKDNLVIASLTFHPTDHVLVFAVGNTIYFWDWSLSEPFAYCQTKFEYERVRWVRFDPQGQHLLTGIANNTTIQQSNTSQVSFINAERQNVINRTQQPRQNRLSNVYDSLVECFHAYRRDRGQNQPSATPAASSVDEARSSEVLPVNESPRSPVLEEGLNLARQYASHITETSAQERQSDPTNDLGAVSNTVTSRLNNPQSSTSQGNQYNRPGSPPPRGASAEDVDVIMEEEILVTNGSGSSSTRNVNEDHQQTSVFRIGSSQSSHSDLVTSVVHTSSSLDTSNSTFSSSGEIGSESGISANISDSSNLNISDPSSVRDTSMTSHSENSQNERSHCTHRRRCTAQNGSTSEPDNSLDCDTNCEVCRNYSRSQMLQNRAFTFHSADVGKRAGIHQYQPLVSRYLRQRQSPFSFSRRREHSSPFVRVIPRSRGQAQNNSCQSLSQSSSESVIPNIIGNNSQVYDFTNIVNPPQRNSASQPSVNVSNTFSNMFSPNVNSPSIDVGASDASQQLNIGQQRNLNFSSDARITDSTESIQNRDCQSNVDFNFANITARIQREMNELDRRISALRNTFNESIRQLQQDRENNSRVGNRRRIRGSNSSPSAASSSQVTPPVITVTRYRDGQRSSVQLVNNVEGESVRESNSSHMLENALRTSPPQVHQPQQPPSDSDEFPDESAHNWHSLQRHHLHPHYAVSILDDTINRPNDALQTAINRAIAGAFMGRGEQAVANNIINQTHRIQMWDFTQCQIPDVTNGEVGVVVPHCKLHNDASCDISQDGTLLTVFVPCHRGFPDDNILSVFSLRPETRGQCLYTKSFGPNAISVSLSPRNNYIMVGLAAKRLSWVFTTKQLVSRIYKLDKEKAGEKSMKHVTDVMHPCDMDVRTHVSVNSARWLPGVGEGMVYGTNRGDLHLCRPGSKTLPDGEKQDNPNLSGSSIRRNLMHMLGLSAGTAPLISIATQTGAHSVRRSAGTQTDDIPE